MGTSSHKSETTPIPVQLAESEFNQFILPHLSLPLRGPLCKVGYGRVFNFILWVLYTGARWKMLPIPELANGKKEIHHTRIFRQFARWSKDGSREAPFLASVKYLHDQRKLDLSLPHGDGTNTVAKKGGDLIGYSGHQHQRGEKVLAITDNHGYSLSPLPAAPVNQTDLTLLPNSLGWLKWVAATVGVHLAGSVLNLDAGFDSRKNRNHVWNAGLKPNIKENPRNRKGVKRGRKRFFDAELFRLRFRIERSFGWEDKFRRLLIRFEFLHQHHLGCKLLAYTMINIREFRGS